MPPLATRASYVGFGKETTPGTSVAPTVFTPATAFTPQDVRNYVQDQGIRGAFVDTYNQIPTQGWSTYFYDSNLYVDSMGPALKSLLGEEAVSGTGPYTHVFDVLNSGAQPTTYTVADYNGFNMRRFAYSLCNSVQVNFDASGLLTYTAQWMGFASATATTTASSFTAVPAKAAYVGTVSIGGSSTLLVQSGNVTMARNVVPILAINASTSPTAMFGGGVSSTGSLTIIYQDDTFLTPFLNGTAQALDLSWTAGSGAGTQTFTYHATTALFTNATVDRGEEYVRLNVDFESVANTTDVGSSGGYSPVKATLVNAVTAAY